MGSWTDVLTVKDLQEKLIDTKASEEHWKLRKDRNKAEIMKSDGDSCSFCQRLADKSGCYTCPINLREGQTCINLDVYVKWTKQRDDFCCVICSGNAARPMYEYIVTMRKEIESVLKERLFKVGERVHATINTNMVGFYGKIVKVNLTGGKGSGSSAYTYDVKREDRCIGVGYNSSYRLFDSLNPKIKLVVPKEDKKLDKKINRIEVGARISVRSDTDKSANCIGTVVALGGTFDDYSLDVIRDSGHGGVGKDGSFRVFHRYNTTIVALTEGDEIKLMKNEIEALKSEIKLEKTKLKDADVALRDVALFIERGRVETDTNLKKLYDQVSNVRRSLQK